MRELKQACLCLSYLNDLSFSDFRVKDPSEQSRYRLRTLVIYRRSTYCPSPACSAGPRSKGPEQTTAQAKTACKVGAAHKVGEVLLERRVRLADRYQ